MAGRLRPEARQEVGYKEALAFLRSEYAQEGEERGRNRPIQVTYPRHSR